jgi:hypothetical protein
MLTSPTYLHFEGTAVWLMLEFMNVILGMVLQIMEKSLIQNTTPHQVPKTSYISYYIIHDRCMAAFRHLPAMVRKYQFCTSRHTSILGEKDTCICIASWTIKSLGIHIWNNILCFADHASWNMHVMKPSWCTIYLQFIQSLYLFTCFRLASIPSSVNCRILESLKHVEV